MSLAKIRGLAVAGAEPAADVVQASTFDLSDLTVQRRTILWVPVALLAGIWLYFALPIEPHIATAITALAASAALLWRANARALPILAAVVLAGFALGKLRAEWVGTPIVTAPTGEVLVVGLVEDIRPRSKSRDDVILAPEQIEYMTAASLPHELKLTSFKRLGTPSVGDRISFKARLSPLPGPVMPGGFDYGRQLYFSGIGGTGRITGPVSIIGERQSFALWVTEAISGLRSSINSRIMAALPGEEGSLAAALITGERANIPKDTLNSLQVSGLFHILSISGLHMSLAAGGMFWFVRAVLALSPRLALTWPIKKLAAVAALAGGFIYMLLAGSGAATERSYIMVAIMLFAILVDRPAISLRNLAIAAIIILVLQPESAIEASFQMSFTAVMGLAAFFEWWNSRTRDLSFTPRSLPMRALRWLALAAAASVMTSLVAGTLSSIPAAYHFGRIAPYGVLANGLAIPIVSFLVMPAALIALLVMPMGLEALPLQAMGYGLQQVLAVSDWVAKLPGAANTLPQISTGSVLVIALGATLLCIGVTKTKPWGLAIVMAGLLWAAQSHMPDLLIERTGSNVAFLDGNNEIVLARPRKAAFAAKRWLQSNGEDVAPAQAAARPGWACEGDLCRASVKGKRIAYMASDAARLPDCASFDLLIAAVPLRGSCRNGPVRIDRFDLWRKGATAVQIDGDSLKVITAADVSGHRPWVVVPSPRRKVVEVPGHAE